jgi:glycosyltransferase involved in cell wall biosynthesis
MSVPRPKRLLHIIESTTAGVRRYVTYLLQHKPPHWDVEVACPIIRQAHFGDIAFVEDIQRLGVCVHDVPLQRSIGWGDVRALRNLGRVIRQGSYDLIHTHSSKAGFLGRLVDPWRGVPVVHTPNGLYYLGQSGPKRWFYQELEWLAGRRTARLIAVSEGERAIMLHDRLAAPDRICLIENGVDAHHIRQRAASAQGQRLREQLRLDGQRPILGGAGRLVPQKDPLTFVRAAARLLTTYPDMRVVWCGDGELRAEMEQLAVQLRVPLLITGHQENSAAVLRAFDVFILPSIYEGLPFTLLEAMALDVPVVASDISGIREVLGDQLAGWLAAPRDDEAIAAALYHILNQPDEAQRRTALARQLVETRFSVEQMAQQHAALYEEVLQGGHPYFRPTACVR